MQINGAAAHLYAGAIFIHTGNELRLSIQRDPPQLHLRINRQAPAGCHFALQPILHGVSLPGEVQPQGSLETQIIRIRERIPAADDFNLQRLARLEQVGRQLPPMLRQTGLARIHLRAVGDLHQADLRPGFKSPHLLLRPGCGLCGQRNLLQIIRVVAIHLQLPLPGLHLHAQFSVRTKSCRQLAAHLQRHKTIEQWSAEHHFTLLSGDLKHHQRRYLKRMAIAQLAGDHQRQFVHRALADRLFRRCP